MNDNIEYTNIYYFYYLNKIGGTETFLYHLAKKYTKLDLVIVYEFGNEEQIKRLSKYAKCIKYTEQTFKCKKAFFNYGTRIINHIHAQEYIFVVHADYKAAKEAHKLEGFTLPPQINRCVAVSKLAAQKFTEAMGVPCEYCYNPFEPEQPKKVLNLISATRLSYQKGKTRMELLANALDRAKIPYLWTIFTDDTQAIKNPNVFYMTPKMNIIDYIANADYLVQLSDNEGYCYSVIEALTAGVPVLITPCPVFEELQIKNKEHGYILPFDMKNLPIEDIYNHIPKVKYTPPKDEWDKLLAHGYSDYQEKASKTYIVKATKEYVELNIRDSTLERVPKVGEQWTVNYHRLQTLLGDNKYNKTFVKVVGTK